MVSGDSAYAGSGMLSYSRMPFRLSRASDCVSRNGKTERATIGGAMAALGM